MCDNSLDVPIFVIIILNSSAVMCKIVLVLGIICYCTILPFSKDTSNTNIHSAENYPRWLINNSYQTSQTSGITFLREREDGSEEFLLADDIGKIHRLIITNDTIFNFYPIVFSDEVNEYLSEFPKLDFEEILYDRFTGDIYLSIEGNGDNHLLYHGIFKLKFKDDNIFQDTITNLEKMNFLPQEEFYNELAPNTGYEGFAADENYFYLGLESVLTEEGSFTGHTILRIADKKTLKIVKEINTEELEISTICGLYSYQNNCLYGIDRNQRKLFKLELDEYLSIVDLEIFELQTVVPGFNQIEYIGSLESVTLAKDKSIYIVDDPWHSFFIPPAEILNQLDKRTIKNFKEFIPVIYKYLTE